MLDRVVFLSDWGCFVFLFGVRWFLVEVGLERDLGGVSVIDIFCSWEMSVFFGRGMR